MDVIDVCAKNCCFKQLFLVDINERKHNFTYQYPKKFEIVEQSASKAT